MTLGSAFHRTSDFARPASLPAGRPSGIPGRRFSFVLSVVVLAVAWLAPGCGGGAAPGIGRTYTYPVRPGEPFDLNLGRPLAEGELAERLADARLVFAGEHHDEFGSHEFQARVLRTLLDRGRQVVIALEMLPPAADPALRDWSAGRIGEEEFLERSGWYTRWGFAWGFYRDLFALFQEHRLAVHGINVTREQRSSAAKGELAPELREEVGGLDLEVEPHRRYLSDALTDNGHGDGLTVESPQFLRLLRVQVLWDHVMGNRAAKLAGAGGADSVVLVLIGSGHLAFKLGANLRAARARPDLPQITLLDRYTHRQNLDADGRFPIPVGLADVVRVDLLRKDATKPPTLRGLKLAAAEAGIRVEGLGRFMPSRFKVFRQGDVIQSLNGVSYANPVALRLAYEALASTAEAQWAILRDGKPLTFSLPIRGKAG